MSDKVLQKLKNMKHISQKVVTWSGCWRSRSGVILPAVCVQSIWFFLFLLFRVGDDRRGWADLHADGRVFFNYNEKMFLKLYRYEELTQSFAEKEQGRFQQIYLNLSKYEVKTSANLKHRNFFFFI